MARVTYADKKIEGIEIEHFEPCQPGVNQAAAAATLSCLWS
jgi:hypothetical protein